MIPIQTFNVVPRLPPALEPLRDLPRNLWWTWEPRARALFREIDPELWNRTNHSPLRVLQLCKQARFEELAQNENFIREMKTVLEKFRAYMSSKDTWWENKADKGLSGPVAYFSAEFGFHESFPNYSGGLGILSGDHCKSASDLGLPFVAVSLLYRHGYFKQQISKDGWQESVAIYRSLAAQVGCRVYLQGCSPVQRGARHFEICARDVPQRRGRQGRRCLHGIHFDIVPKA